MEAVDFAGEVERIEPDARDGFGLFGAEVHLQAQPAAAFHPDKLTTGVDEGADLLLGEIHALDLDDDLQVEPVDLLIDDLEGDLSLDRICLERGKVGVGDDFDALGERLEPLGVFLGEILRHPGAVAAEIAVEGRLHRGDEPAGAALETAIVAEDVLSVALGLPHDFPSFATEHFLAAFVGIDRADFHQHVLARGGGGPGGNTEIEEDAQRLLANLVFEVGGEIRSQAEEEGDPRFALDDGSRDDDPRIDQGLAARPMFGAAEDPLVAHVERLVAGEETDGVGDILAASGDELHLVVVRAHRIGAADPAERLFAETEGLLVEIDDEPLELALVEKAIEEAAILNPVEAEATVVRFSLRGGVDEFAPEDLRSRAHAQSAVGVALLEPRELLGVGDAFEGPFASRARHQSCLAGADAETELDGFDRFFGRAFFEDLDLVAPLALFAALFPGDHLFPGPVAVGNHLEEGGNRVIPLFEGVGDVVPELHNVLRRARPKDEGIEGIDRPTGIQAHEVGVEDLALEFEAAEASFDLPEVFVFFSVESAAELFLDHLGEGLFSDLVRGLGEIAFASHFLQHRRIERGAARVALLIRFADPFVALQLDAGAAGPVLVLNTALDEEMIAKNLGDRSLLVEALAFFFFVVGE